MAVSGSSNVTISLLPTSLSLVRIPRFRLPHLSHPILRQILQPKPVFLNVTCNEVELSLFAEHHVLSDFELIARRDRHKLRSRSGSGSGSVRKRPIFDDDDRVEFSCEKWKVLQLDFHSDQLDNSGARVHELSAPLAAAGISILYQSSYMSDFIFVKESRLREVMSLFGAAGFDLYSSDPEPLMSRVVSPLLSPVLPDVFQASDIGPEFHPESGAVLTRTRSSIDNSVAATASTLQKLDEDAYEKSGTGRTPHNRSPSRNKSYSPSCTDVTVLRSKLACVGLADDCVDSWSLKVVKLIAFPDLIPMKESHLTHGPGFRYNYAAKPSSGKGLDEITIPSFLSWPRRGSDSTDSASSSSEHEGYISHSPRRDPPWILPVTSSHSYPDITHAFPSVTPSFKPSSRHLASQVASLSPAEFKVSRLDRSTTRSPVETRQPNNTCSRVPFFSFTRTFEGSSLTTDVSILAALFPPGERHMLICAGELDALDAHEANSDSDSDEEQNSDTFSETGTLKCLQIDLCRFGLDKHGLVSRYSRVLEENGINHMYSSTFKTANLLVAKSQASRARDLLKAC